ncbi:MAG: dihydropteroate synthase [Rhodospirillales bacterium]|nr:dihydropteroate synthase [Rhodospirillales bacterium]
MTPPGWAGLTLDRPRVMGILNVTPDSFSDGGTHVDGDAAIAAGRALAAAGADIVDVGGESTRPGAVPTDPAEEIRRIRPVVRGLAAAGILVSIDTRNAATMEAALDAGAALVNDVSALAHDPDAAPLVASRRVPVVLMHMRGTPQTMAAHAAYADVTGEVIAELAARIAAAAAAGIAPEAICLDPGIGFAKREAHGIELLRRLPELAVLGRPLLVGVSRKRFIGRLSGVAEPRERLAGSLAAGLFAVSRGAAILRVHNVFETVQALRVWHALSG